MLYALVATFVIGGVAFAADAFVVSDRDQLEILAGELTSGAPETRLDGVLGAIDLSRAAVTITSDRQPTRYEDGDSYALDEHVARTLEPFTARDLEVVQRAIHVDGDRGTVALRVRADGSVHDARIGLVRSGQGWLITDIR
jgi:hypothetical protein